MAGKLPIRAFFDELADAIANPSPSRPMREAVGKQGRAICDALSVVPAWARELPGLQRDVLFATCAPYWDNEQVSPPVSQPPFSGGQCPKSYRVDATTTTFNRAGEVSLSGSGLLGFFTGPIRGIDYDSACSSTIIGPLAPGAGGFCAYILTGQGRSFVGGDGNGGLRITITSVTPQSGADDCGDPPGVIEPGPNPAPNPPIIPVDERPYLDPVEGPILPIPDLPGLPGFPGIPWRNPFGTGGPSPSVPGDPGSPGDPVDTTGPGDPAEGEAAPGEELVALKLTLLETPEFAQRLQNEVFRSVAFVYMGTVAGLDQDPAGALVRDGQLVYAERSGLTRWRVTANVGFVVQVTPFYQEVN